MTTRCEECSHYIRVAAHARGDVGQARSRLYRAQRALDTGTGTPEQVSLVAAELRDYAAIEHEARTELEAHQADGHADGHADTPDPLPGPAAVDLGAAGEGPHDDPIPILDLDDRPWVDQALCAQTDPEAFFPEKGGSTRDAKATCRGCTVRAECLEEALATGQRFGIWGGLSERERRHLHQQWTPPNRQHHPNREETPR